MTAAFRARPRVVLLCCAALALGAASNGSPDAPGLDDRPLPRFGEPGDLSVMTYNVKGLPWPLAWGRDDSLRRIGDRLALLRERGQQPDVVVLQEAFTGEAKAIGERSGYRYRVVGPHAESVAPAGRADVPRSWYLGETQGKLLDSGLVVLSDLPIRSIRRAPFPARACAGFDCLAAKGVVLVTLTLPGGSDVAVATTHFNSRGASRAPREATGRAYADQSAFLAAFLEREWNRRIPLVVAGDFNMGQRPFRTSVLQDSLARLADGERPPEGLRSVMEADGRLERSPDARWIRYRARDMQFVFDGAEQTLEPVGTSIPFGTEADGATLSDHMGFTIRYRVVAAGSADTRASRKAA